tara:strand:+ start:62 stop:283 length:222 start_codon:yes stop_codon:yes gene_type:complete
MASIIAQLIADNQILDDQIEELQKTIKALEDQVDDQLNQIGNLIKLSTAYRSMIESWTPVMKENAIANGWIKE